MWMLACVIVISIFQRRSLLVPVCQWFLIFPRCDFALMGQVHLDRLHVLLREVFESQDACVHMLSDTTQQTLCKKFSLRSTPPSQHFSHRFVVPSLPCSARQGVQAIIASSCRRPRCRTHPWSIDGMGLRRGRWLAYCATQNTCRNG